LVSTLSAQRSDRALPLVECLNPFKNFAETLDHAEETFAGAHAWVVR
jgi:hypothetical protein